MKRRLACSFGADRDVVHGSGQRVQSASLMKSSVTQCAECVCTAISCGGEATCVSHVQPTLVIILLHLTTSGRVNVLVQPGIFFFFKNSVGLHEPRARNYQHEIVCCLTAKRFSQELKGKGQGFFYLLFSVTST